MTSQTKMIMGGAVVALLVFYGGFSYGKNHASAAGIAARGTFGMGGQASARTARMGMGGAQFGGFVVGKILSKDATSMTVSLQNGGSKIVFLSSSTPIMKTVAGTASDLAVGTTVQVAGTASSDGSVTARSVEIRPEMSALMTRPNSQ